MCDARFSGKSGTCDRGEPLRVAPQMQVARKTGHGERGCDATRVCIWTGAFVDGNEGFGSFQNAFPTFGCTSWLRHGIVREAGRGCMRPCFLKIEGDRSQAWGQRIFLGDTPRGRSGARQGSRRGGRSGFGRPWWTRMPAAPFVQALVTLLRNQPDEERLKLLQPICGEWSDVGSFPDTLELMPISYLSQSSSRQGRTSRP